ncbi:imidazoleglycerol-phosphate dehydratase HisB [Acidobacteriota bacterium]
MKRQATFERKTRETEIRATLALEGAGNSTISTPVGFFSHILETFAKHGRFDLEMSAGGDLHVDQHHLIEDCGLVLGTVFSRALQDKKGIERAGYFVFPMDEALAVAAVDLNGRPYLQFDMSLSRRMCGDLDTDLMESFLQAFATGLQANVVVRMPFGRSDHHKLEAAFKALGKAMNMACQIRGQSENIPSTKGVIDDSRDR